MEQKTIFIVGGAGYVGEMLCDQLGKRADVQQIVVLDKAPQSDYGQALPKVTYIQHNMADDGWQEVVATYAPDTIIHTAWQIRALYGRSKEQWRWNVEGSGKIFDFALTQPSVQKLLYFSSAASYSACADNHPGYFFTEEDGFRDDDYIYAHEKKVTEENLKVRYDQAKKEGKTVPQVSVFRPAAITGPRGRFMRMRFGLQSALAGNLKGGFVNRLITLLTTFVPATKGWARQFIHEDDVADIVLKFVFEEMDWEYGVFNITPVTEPILARDMAKAVEKKILPVQPWMVRLAFAVFWHATRGRVPTCPGAWRVYSYPVLMSGQKLTTLYTCKYSSKDAFRYTSGRYADCVPNHKKRPQPK